ncbi:hypothetical protein DID76_02805 [Candidatus Marinamargulisbacteria bacterium SCGC AG-414-C22]|nr:hypothetical protein DID76_02805 [Candidatus Marinamargulisbacteria bacterium SCGC AG-414-C22]
MNIMTTSHNNNKFSIIAETAFSHEGNFEYLIKLTDAAKKSKSDYIKYQIVLNRDNTYSKYYPFYTNIEQWSLSEDEWSRILIYANTLKLKVIVLPVDCDALEFCFKKELLINGLEIHSVCFNEIPFLEKIALYKKDIFLGIGGRLPNEISFVKETLKSKHSTLILMFGFQSFPTNKQFINLSKIPIYQSTFKSKVGYADHTAYDDPNNHELSKYAFLLGCNYIEKHLVLKKGKKRVDYEAGIQWEDFIALREELDKLNVILGSNNIFKLNPLEKKYRNREKKIVAIKNIKKNEILTSKNISYKVTDEKSSFQQMDYKRLLGKQVKKSIQKDFPLTSDHVSLYS